jgi:glutamate racemase
VEAGEQKSVAVKIILEQYLRPLLRKNIDTLILGCTHYVVLKKTIERIVGSKIRLISEDKVVPRKLKSYLKRHPEIEKRLSRDGVIRFFTTDQAEKFTHLGSAIFGENINVEKTILL